MPNLQPALRADPVTRGGTAVVAGCDTSKPPNKTAPASRAPAEMGKLLKDLFPKGAADGVGEAHDVDLRRTGPGKSVRRLGRIKL